MTHEGQSSLISLGLSPHFLGEDSSFRWWVVGSLGIHALLIIFLTTLRFTPSFEQPLHSYEVSLINLSEVQAPPATSKTKAKPPKAQPAPPPKAKTRPPEPKAEVFPPLPTQTAAERLSESFSGAVQSVVVPHELSLPSQLPTEPESIATPQTETKNVLEHIKLPTTAPKLTPPTRLEPKQRVSIPDRAPEPPQVPHQTSPSTPPPTPAQSNVRQETQKALQTIKAPPEAPTLKPIQPFRRTERKDIPDPQAEKLSDTLKQSIQSVKVPKPRRKAAIKKFPARPKADVPVTPPSQTHSTLEAPQLAQVNPTKKKPNVPEVKQERLADSLKQVLDTVKIPNLRKRPTVESPQQHQLEPQRQVSKPQNPLHEPDSTRTQKLKTEIDQQLARLKVPDVAPIESIQKRLQIQAVTTGETDDGTSSSTSSKTSRSSSGQNRYLALVEAKIDQHWVAPAVSMDQRHMKVMVKFRILRTGEVTNLTIKEGSGNAYYDSAAQRAVQASNPLPPFPADLHDSYLDVLYKFSLGEFAS